ncbi:MAG: hypothetical protein AAF985_13190 [Bacteroidota bacterium]
MENLKAYLSLIDLRLLQHISGKPGEFIRLFQQKNYLSEEAFMTRICGQKHSAGYYRELKSRTIAILQRLALIGAIKGANPVKKKLDNCRKFFVIGQKFLGNGERLEGLRLIKKSWKIAVQYDFTYLACELASILYHDHIYYHPDEKKADHFAERVTYYLKAYTAEKQIEHYLYQILGAKNQTLRCERALNAVGAVERMNGTSVKFKMYEHTIHAHYGFSISDYEYVIKHCRRVFEFYSDADGVYSSYIYSAHKNQGVAHMALGQYDQAAQSFAQAQPFAPAKSFNDYLLRLYTTFNMLHSGQYEIAYTLHKQNKRCRFVLIRDQFAIIEAYLCFLSHTGSLSLDRPFRLGKYLNETFKAQRDKQGDNINILIAELLVYLARNRGKFIDRIEAVRHYSYRHLKDRDTQRAKRFLKILYALPRANFHPVALHRLAKTHIDYLKTNPIRMGSNFAVEIIPFDALLDMITVYLNQKAA